MSATIHWGFPEQEQACARLLHSRGGVVWWKPGAGKTRIGIEWFEQMRAIYSVDQIPVVCVVVLKRTAFLDFRKEIIKLDYDCVILEDDLDDIPAATQLAMLQKPTLLLVSAAMLTKTNEKLLMDARVRYGILDELHMFKNPQAARSKAAYRLSQAKKTIGLSGSIMTKGNLEDIYGQLMAVCKHRYVASNMTEFRSKFLHMKMMERKDGQQYPWRFPKQGSYRKIMELCADCIHVYEPPKKNRKIDIQILSVPSTPEQTRAFSDLRKWMELELPDGNFIEYKNKLEVAIRIQQISNGWFNDADGITRELTSNKPNVLVDKVMEVVAAGERCVIWCAFRHDVHLLEKAFAAKQIATLQFMSGVPFDSVRWQGDTQVCLATEAMGVSVNHFEHTPYAFYFSQNYSWLDLQQSMARTDRHSSTHPTAFYYFCQVEGSLDQHIYQNVNNARDWENRLIDIGEALTRWQKNT